MAKRVKFNPDAYGAVHLSPEVCGDLTTTIHEIKSVSDVTAVWLYLKGRKELMLLTTALDLGFVFHHATGEDVVLGLWLKPDIPNTLPKGSTHTIGVGCMVVDMSAEKVLVVKEKVGPAKGRFKMVTGLVDVG